jgi:hypothetical protein
MQKLHREENLRAAFQELDQDGGGTITKDELMQVGGAGCRTLVRPRAPVCASQAAEPVEHATCGPAWGAGADVAGGWRR